MRIDRRSMLAGAASLVAAPQLSRLARAAPSSLRVSSVKFGSVSWLLDTIAHGKLAAKHGLQIDILEVANNQAGPIALLGGSADIIVSDWTWALRQRGLGEQLRFAPYSSALGALMVPQDSPIKSFPDLDGKRLGVAGSAIDKSWLLMRAYAVRTLGKDLTKVATPVFGAAPLVTEQMRDGRLDAVLNFWTYAARLNGGGYRQLISMKDVLKALDIDPVPSLVGFVWKESLEADKSAAIAAFLKAVADANEVLRTSDEAWERLRPLVVPQSDAELVAIRDYYRAGIPHAWGHREMRAAEKLLDVLVSVGDAELVGDGTRFDPDLFYSKT